MRPIHALAVLTFFGMTAGTAHSMPVTAGALAPAAAAIDLVDQTAVYVVSGRRYCFYFDGWHGPGWYRCGFAWRSGLGWGGAYGWRGWHYGPAARRFRGPSVTIRERGPRFYQGDRYRGDVRGRTTIRERSTIRSGDSTTIRRGDGPAFSGETTGRGSSGRQFQNMERGQPQQRGPGGDKPGRRGQQ
jgi:hypothetical protein